VEAPFQLAIAGRVVRGRIDAVYKEGDGETATYEIVDWKTNRDRTADPLQLALYRLAWAEQQGVPLESVTAAFLYVRSGEIDRPDDLADRSALERLLLEDPSASAECEEPPTEDVGAGR
jgi:DNA helicase-2/ATP-dependent DNA helicase PcrA